MTRRSPFTRPLAPLAFALLAGILLGARVPGFTGPALWAFLLFSVAAALLAVRGRPTLVTTLFAFVALGFLSIQPVLHPRVGPDHVAGFVGRGDFRVTGEVDGPPVVKEEVARAVLTDLALVRGGQSQRVRGRIRLTMRPPRRLSPGDRLVFTSDLRGFRDFANPGGFAYERSMRLAGISASAYAGPDSDIEVFPARKPGLLQGLRDRVRAALARYAPEKGRGLLCALLLGDRSAVGEQVREDFLNSGTVHVLAISGLHVGLVAAFFLLVFRFFLLRVPRLAESGRALRLAGLLCLVPVLFYAGLAGMSPSTRRAVLMAAVFFLALGIKRPYDPMNTLAAAGLVIAAAFPGLVFSIGMQLSFAAVFFILLGIGPLEARAPKLRAGLPGKALRYLWGTAAVCLLAFIGTAPLVLHAFHRVALFSPLANLVVVPLVGLAVLPLGLAGVLALFLWPPASMPFFRAAGLFAGLGQDAAAAFARLPLSRFMPVLPSLPEILLFYVAFTCLFFLRRGRAWRIAFAASLVLLAADAAYWINERYYDPNLRVAILDVGQGSAAVARFPGGTTMVVDAGPILGTDFDLGERVVAPFLWANKIRRVDILVLSHPQMDHLGGMPYIAENFSPGEIWVNGQESDLKPFARLEEVCREKGIPLRARSGLPDRQQISGVEVLIINPGPDFCGPCQGGRRVNRNSLALRLGIGDTGLILPGDMTIASEREAAERFSPRDLCSTAMVVPHHGSRGSSSPEFISLVRPRVAVVSAGYRNRFDLPAPGVLADYARAGALIFRTDEDGAVELILNGSELKVRPYASGSAGKSTFPAGCAGKTGA